MLWIGLSGGIGSGKSTVSAELARHGAVIIDADVLAREVVAAGTTGLVQVQERFGSGILTQAGELDRPALGRIVFADPVARRDLEAITHPLIAMRTRELIETAPPRSILVHDVPLLVELGYAPRYHLVVIVGASDQVRLDRLVTDRGMSAAEATNRIDAQSTDAERRAVADVWLDNEGSLEGLRQATQTLYAGRLVPYLANLERGRGVPTHSLPAGAEAQRLAARLSYVLRGDLDGQLGLDPGSDSLLVPLAPGVTAASVVERLTQAGFPPVGRGLHASADPGRPVLLTVREHVVSAGG